MSKPVKWQHENIVNVEPALTYELVIPHTPKAQARPRAAVVRCTGGVRATMYKPRENMMAEEEVRRYWEDLIETLPPEEATRFPWEGPVKMVVRYVFQIPKTNYWEGREKEGKPDMDNLQKMLQDALNKYAWLDDSQIIGKHTEKMYGVSEGTYATLEFYERVEKPVKRKRVARPRETNAERSRRIRKEKREARLLAIVEGAE